MDFTDILHGADSFIGKNKPRSPDMDRISDIVLEMRANKEKHEGAGDFMQAWRAEIEKTIDFDALAWQSIQVGAQLFNIETGADYLALKLSPRRLEDFIKCIQGFYDGFLLGVRFQEKGGHRG